MTKATILGLIRHVLTFGGGLLVTHGYVQAGDIETGVGALITLIGLAWSAWDKRQRA